MLEEFTSGEGREDNRRWWLWLLLLLFVLAVAGALITGWFWLQKQSGSHTACATTDCNRPVRVSAVSTKQTIPAACPTPDIPASRPFEVYFAFDSVRFQDRKPRFHTPGHEQILDEIAADYTKLAHELESLHASCPNVYPAVSVVIGHADAVGTQAYNMKLSSRRADAVRAALVSEMTQRDPALAPRFTLCSYGASHLAHPELRGRSLLNRRAQIWVDEESSSSPEPGDSQNCPAEPQGQH
jgi:outer membrane protein OmpA-like peptidoglycan-associated protein